MEQLIHILHLEDDPADTELIQTKIEAGGLTCQITRVQTGDELGEALCRSGYDIILADYRLPHYDGLSALRLAQELCPDLPFIFVSGAMGEDAAIEGLTEGATDYVLKQRLSRLVSAIKRALKEAENRRERRRAEEQLRESEMRFRQFFENAGAYCYLVSPEGFIMEANAKALKTLGYSREELVGRPLSALYAEESIEQVKQLFQKWKETGSVQNAELVIKTKNGERRWVILNANAVRDDAGRIIHSTSMQVDITERKQAEERQAKLEDQNRQLQKAESLGRMAGAIAHRFNNLLTVVTGHLELAMKDLPSQWGPVKNLSQAMLAAHKAAEVSGLMLTYLGQTPGKCEPLDPAEDCYRSLLTLQVIMPAKVTLETDLPTPGPIIHADVIQIRQLLVNLITNAEEAIGDNQGVIYLAVKTVSSAEISANNRFPIDWQPQNKFYACLSVTDTGCGVAKYDIEKLFDPFFSNKLTGRGLGLSVVLGIVRAHSGCITVESESGKGSAFRVFIPVMAQSETPREPDRVPEVPEGDGGGTILLVEDEEMVRRMAEEILTHLGFTVLATRDGVEAVEVFCRHQAEIRCVLCDLTMPRMGGWETLMALHQIAPDIPVVLASGYDEAQVMAGSHSERPQVFLKKPYRIKEISDAIRHALGSRETKT